MTDFHTHVWPDGIAEAAVKSLAARAKVPAYTDGTVGGLRKSMADAGVSLSVILPVITKASQFDSITKFALGINEKYEDLISFGAVFPGDPDYKKELRLLKEYGFKGIKLHPDYQRVRLDSKESMNIIYEASALGFIITVHAGIDIGLPENPCSTPDMALKVLEEIKPDALVLAHTGGWKVWGEVEKLLCGREVYFDLSFTNGYIENEQWVRIIKKHGASRCLFGTDSPWSSPKDTGESLKKLGLPEEDLEMIFEGTANKLLEAD